jgi:DNA processing protein
VISPRLVERGTGDYPALLETIEDPPERLWVRGALPSEPGVAVVGTRRATRYGLELARQMGGAIARAGWTVVSGLARGVDGAAHRGTLEGGGKGVAVLGSGIDVWYPPEHARLGEQLVTAGGAVISEYPPGSRPDAWRFPRRNRIISGLARAVVVVEAADKGGALITARLGAEQGREVFAVPGDVSRRTSVGTNLLIRDGAVPVLGAGDLIEALSLVLGPPSAGTPTPFPIGIEIPPGGIAIDDFIAAHGGNGPELLGLLGRLEAEGLVRIEGGEVVATS